MSRCLIAYLLTLLLVCSFISCSDSEAPPTQPEDPYSPRAFEPDSFRSRALPDESNSIDSVDDLVDWAERQTYDDLFLYGLSYSPFGSVLFDSCNYNLSGPRREIILQYLAFRAGWQGIEMPDMTELAEIAPRDCTDFIITPGSPEELTQPVTERRASRGFIFFPRHHGPAYGIEFGDSASLDNVPVIYGTHYYYLHRVNGSPSGAYLSWIADQKVRTSGVAIPNYNSPNSVQLRMAFEYVDPYEGIHEKAQYPHSFTFTHQNCPEIPEGQSCTATSVLNPTHGFTWRPGCYEPNGCVNPGETYLYSDCAISNGETEDTRFDPADIGGWSLTTRGCPNVHLYYNVNGALAYTEYNDNRWRIDAAIPPGYSSVVTQNVSPAHFSRFLNTTVYVMCVPFFKTWARESATDDSSVPLWCQMFDGWIPFSNWTNEYCDPGVWRGTANVLMQSADAWRCNLGCGCIGFETCPTNEDYIARNHWGQAFRSDHTSWVALPYKQKMTWQNSPWSSGGLLRGVYRTFHSGGANYCTGSEQNMHSEYQFGELSLRDNSYSTSLKVKYDEYIPD